MDAWRSLENLRSYVDNPYRKGGIDGENEKLVHIGSPEIEKARDIDNVTGF